MSFLDLMQMSLRNLYRRKGRTALTVSGVVIGCCAIMIMVSLGIGMKESQTRMLESMGNLTRITVNPAPKGNAGKILLNKKAVQQMQNIPGVKSVIVKDNLDVGELQLVEGKENRYVCSGVTIVGVEETDFEKMGYLLQSGEFPSGKPYEVLVGQNFAFQFEDTKRPAGKNMVDYWSDENAKPFFTPERTEVFLKQKKEKAQSGEENPNTIKQIQWKEIQKMMITGVLKQNYDTGEETDSGLVMRLKDLEKLRNTILKINGGSKAKEYSQVLVNVNDIKDVEAAQQSISRLGFETYSMESVRKPMEKDAQQKQLMLGGLGAISLIVAAIGIANTMIMSISERTREIGIMKALGCFLEDIKKEFLMEAAVIGFIGGSLGITFSYLISWAMNSVSGAAAGGGMEEVNYFSDMSSFAGAGSQISIIPWWLTGFSLLFAVFIGVAAGYYPANKAVRISALEAMKG